jgi:hypothetical protein
VRNPIDQIAVIKRNSNAFIKLTCGALSKQIDIYIGLIAELINVVAIYYYAVRGYPIYMNFKEKQHGIIKNSSFCYADVCVRLITVMCHADGYANAEPTAKIL